jgi:type II secretory pathway pseudopilin PulG
MSINVKKTLTGLNWAGDTIVEVLIVIVVLGTVIASAYSIAVGSLQSVQLAQERAYALKVAEAQVERLKAVASGPDGAATLSSSSGFCILVDSATAKTYPALIDSPSPTPDMDSDNYANYHTCSQSPNGSACVPDGWCYYFGIKHDLATSNYAISVRWEGPRGKSQQVQLSYRVYAI